MHPSYTYVGPALHANVDGGVSTVTSPAVAVPYNGNAHSSYTFTLKVGTKIAKPSLNPSLGVPYFQTQHPPPTMAKQKIYQMIKTTLWTWSQRPPAQLEGHPQEGGHLIPFFRIGLLCCALPSPASK